jgi:phage internal scaffolding protein
MMKRFGVTGKLPENPRVPQYGDFSEITDYRSAIEAIRNADEKFMEFPADVRALFENNPQNVLDFVANPANIDAVKQIFGEKTNVDNVGKPPGITGPTPSVASTPVPSPGTNPPAAKGG